MYLKGGAPCQRTGADLRLTIVFMAAPTVTSVTTMMALIIPTSTDKISMLWYRVTNNLLNETCILCDIVQSSATSAVSVLTG
jgi:hypothetical protein